MSSTYHQCIKFPSDGQEVVIPRDPNPFSHCNSLKPMTNIIVPHNREAPKATPSNQESTPNQENA